MNNQNINAFSESEISELTQTINDINPELFEKIIKNNKKCYYDDELNLSNCNLSLDKIKNDKNIHIDDLLNNNNIIDYKIYYKSILLICKIYNIVKNINKICNYKHRLYDHDYYNYELKPIIKLILEIFDFLNIIDAINILYNSLIDYKYIYDDYIHNLYVSYFLLLKEVKLKDAKTNHMNICDFLCNDHILNDNLKMEKSIKAPIKILNTITNKNLLEICILLIINTDNYNKIIFGISKINLTFDCEYYSNSKLNHDLERCIKLKQVFMSRLICNISLIVDMYSYINNKLLIPTIFNIVKNLFSIRYRTTHICNNCIYTFLLNCFSVNFTLNTEKLILDTIFYHNTYAKTKACNNIIIHDTKYNYINEITNTKIYKKKIKNLARKKIKYIKNKFDCNKNNIKTIIDLLYFMIHSGINIQYYNNMNDILLEYKINNIDHLDDENIKLVSQKILYFTRLYITSRYTPNYEVSESEYELNYQYLTKFNLDFLYYETILLFKCTIFNITDFIDNIIFNLNILIRSQYIDIVPFLHKISNNLNKRYNKNVMKYIFEIVITYADHCGTHNNNMLWVPFLKLINSYYNEYSYLCNVLLYDCKYIFSGLINDHNNIDASIILLKQIYLSNIGNNINYEQILLEISSNNVLFPNKLVMMHLILSLTHRKWNLFNNTDLNDLYKLSLCILQNISTFDKIILYTKDEYKTILNAIKMFIINSNILNTTLDDSSKNIIDEILSFYYKD